MIQSTKIFAAFCAVLLAAVARTAKAQDTGDCFECDNGYINGQNVHSDWSVAYFGTLKGAYHGGWVQGSCAAWRTDGHESYGLEQDDLAAAISAVGDGADALLLKVLHERKTVRINVARSALQLFGESGSYVFYHAPLDRAQTARLVRILSESAPTSLVNHE
jgi:hypothetical protein